MIEDKEFDQKGNKKRSHTQSYFEAGLLVLWLLVYLAAHFNFLK
jgi:hypothetical protein